MDHAGRAPSASGKIFIQNDSDFRRIDSSTSLDHICVQHPALLQIVRDRVLRKQWSLETDFRAKPLALSVRSVDWVFAGPARAEGWAKGSALDLVEVLEFAKGFIADGAGDVELKLYDGHR